jgi:hypothetical protein
MSLPASPSELRTIDINLSDNRSHDFLSAHDEIVNRIIVFLADIFICVSIYQIMIGCQEQ